MLVLEEHFDIRELVQNKKIKKDYLYFELFLLFSYLSGRGLSRIKGFDLEMGLKFTNLVNNFMQERFSEFFYEQTMESLEKGLAQLFENEENYNSLEMRKFAEQFSTSSFIRNFKRIMSSNS